MSKPASKRPFHETEASAYARALKTSPRKLNLVAQLIRGKAAAAALNELTFNRRRIAIAVRKVLQAAIANAENNHQLDVDKLYVKEATVGRAFNLRRHHVRGRGRISPVEKYFSNLLVVVREREEEKVEAGESEGQTATEGAKAGKGKSRKNKPAAEAAAKENA